MKITEKDVLFEDNHLIAVNKSAGILTQSDYRGEESLQEMIKTYLKEKYAKPGNVYLGIVHRLDMGVSGVNIFAKTDKAAARLSKLIRERNFLKLYVALSHYSSYAQSAQMKNEKFYMGRERDFSFVKSSAGPGLDSASLSYKTLCATDKFMMNFVSLGTGRKHQIRAFFSSRKAPIVYDMKYGSTLRHPRAILLHSVMSAFTHPVKNERICIKAPLPDYFRTFSSDNFQASWEQSLQEAMDANLTDFIGE